MKKALIIVGLIILAGIVARLYTQQNSTKTPATNEQASAPNIMQTMCKKNGRVWNVAEEKCEAAPSEE